MPSPLKRLFLALLFIPLAYSGISAFAADCEGRLNFDFASLVQKAWSQGLIGIDDVKRLAESEVPFNPIANETSRSANAALKRVFDAQLASVDWPSQRVKIAEMIAVKSDQVAQVAVASGETDRILAKSLLYSRKLREGRILDHFLAPDGQLVYAMIAGPNIEVVDAGLDKVVYSIGRRDDIPLVYLGLNDLGHVAVEIQFYPDTVRNFLLWTVRHTGFETVVYDLDAKTAHEKSHVTVSSKARKPQFVLTHEPVKGRFDFLNLKGVFGRGTFTLDLTSGRKFKATVSDVKGEPKQRIKIFELDRQPSLIKTYDLAFRLWDRMEIFEQDGSAILVVGSDLARDIAVFDLDGAATAPTLRIETEWRYRFATTQMTDGSLEVSALREDERVIEVYGLNGKTGAER